MDHALLLPAKRVRISRVTPTDAHPLDRHVDGVRNRSEQAFRAVYLAMANDLLSFAFGMLGDRRTAEDMVQQAFIELVESAHQFRGDGKALRAWLFRSVRYGCLDEYRRRSRHREYPSDRLPERAHHDDVISRYLEPNLQRALDSLTERQRTVILLRHVGGLSGHEMARVMKTTRKAVYGVLARAEGNLRQVLREES